MFRDQFFYYYFINNKIAVLAKWLTGQTAVLTERVRAHINAGFQCSARSLHCTLSIMPFITGPTEFIISIVNLRMVNMPEAYPSQRRENVSVYYYIIKKIHYMLYEKCIYIFIACWLTVGSRCICFNTDQGSSSSELYS